MSTFIDLDSFWRDRVAYPNPCDYQLTTEQVETWFPHAREVRAFPSNPTNRPVEFVTSVHVENLTLPYDDALAKLPRVYVNFQCQTYKDIYLISSIDGKQRDARFICFFDKIQTDATGKPIWIHYRCGMEQVVRFKRNEPVLLRIMGRDANVIPFFIDTDPTKPKDPTKQSLITFTITPYLRDNVFSNHNVETTTV